MGENFTFYAHTCVLSDYLESFFLGCMCDLNINEARELFLASF